MERLWNEPRSISMGEMGVGIVGLEQQLRTIVSDSGLGAETHAWKAAESAPGFAACLVRHRGRVAGRDKGTLGRLMLVGTPRWCDVGNCSRAQGVGEACNSCRRSSRRGPVEVSSGARVQRRRRRFQAERCRS